MHSLFTGIILINKKETQKKNISKGFEIFFFYIRLTEIIFITQHKNIQLELIKRI